MPGKPISAFFTRFFTAFLIAGLFLSALSVRQAGAAGPLVIFWDFEEGGGLTANDLSPNGYDGSITNATYSTDVPFAGSQYSLAFDGSGDFVTTTMGSEISGNHSFSVSFWLKYTPNVSARQWVMTIGTPGGSTSVHWLIQAGGLTQFGFWNIESLQNQFNLSPYANQWIQVSTSYDAATQTIRTYINNTLMDTDTYNPVVDPGETPNIAGGVGNNVLLNVGQRQVGSEADFSGWMDNLSIQDSTNVPPSLTLPGANPVSGNEQVEITLDSSAIVSDVEGNWNGGILTVQVTGNAQASDDLEVRDYGNCTPYTTELIDISAGELRRCGPTDGAYTVIGTVAGTDTNNLTVTFNANATTAWVQDVVRSIRFEANTNAPSTLQRTVTFNLTDGAGGSSGDVTKLVDVNPVNDAPLVGNWNAPDPTYTENDPPLQLDTNATISDPDTADLNGTTITVRIQANCYAGEDVLGIGNFGLITTSGSDVLYNGTVFGTFAGGSACADLVVTLNSSADTTSMTALANAFTYWNNSDVPTETPPPYPNTTLGRRIRLQTDQAGVTSNQNGKYVSVIAVDDASDAIDDTATFTEDDPATTIDVRANDTDIEDTLTTELIQSVTQPANGTVEIALDGKDLIYEPNLNYCNDGTPTDDFTYTLAGGDTATVAVTVTCVDDASDAIDDAPTVSEDSGANIIDVRVNDTDIDGTVELIASVTQPDNGTVEIAIDGEDLTYEPNLNYCDDGDPTDDFTYTLAGGDTATVAVTVTCVDDASDAIDDAPTVSEDSGANIIDVRVNDTDIDGTVELIASVTQPANGTVIIALDGEDLTYEPNLNYCNDGDPTDDFTYTLNGGSTATVAVTVNCANDPSDAVDDFSIVNEDAPVTTFDVRSNDTDVEDTLTTEMILSVTQPANGTVVITNSGADLTYQPNPNYCSADESTDDFTYTLAGGDTATVRVLVDCVNDEPDFTASNPPAVFINAGAQTVPGWVTSFVPGPADESWQSAQAYIVSNSTCGSLLSVQPAVSTTGTLTYTPATDQHGTCTFDVQVQDDGGTDNGGDDTGPLHTFTITVNDNLPPTIVTNGIGSIPDTGDGHISEGEIVWVNLTSITVTFSEDMFDPAGNSHPDDVTNPVNYLFLYSDVETFATTTCANGALSPDVSIPITSVTYNNNGGAGPFVATLRFNPGFVFPNGFYRLIVCGTTSVMDLSGNALAGNGTISGTDFTRNFMIFAGGGGGGGGGTPSQSGGGALIPITGFAPNRVTTLTGPRLNYASSNVTIELPRLKLTLPVVGVPFRNGGWDVNWLTAQAGWLEHTAFPGLNGNSVLTSHITSRYGSAGPFASLGKMVVGDLIFVRNNGTLYIFQVERILRVNANDTSIFKHEEKPWLTLVTCDDWDELLGTYLKRIVVRARLIGTQADPMFAP